MTWAVPEGAATIRAVADPLEPLTRLPGVAADADAVREALTRVHNHRANRRGWPATSAEASVRAARASSSLDGGSAELPADGQVADPVLAGALRVAGTWADCWRPGARPPRQALARLHMLAAADLPGVTDDDLGRPRLDPGVGERLDGLAGLVTGGHGRCRRRSSSPSCTASSWLSPLPTAGGVVARAAARLTAVGTGLDPKGLAVPEVGHYRAEAEYRDAAAAFATGEPDGLATWFAHCARAWQVGARGVSASRRQRRLPDASGTGPPGGRCGCHVRRRSVLSAAALRPHPSRLSQGGSRHSRPVPLPRQRPGRRRDARRAPMAGTGGSGGRRAVVMTDDEELLDDVVRLAAAAGAELERVPDATGVRRRWHTAGLVLVDEDAARALGPLRLGRRDGVVLVCRGEPPGSVWERAVVVGAEHVVSLPDGEQWLVSTLAETGPAGEGGGTGRVVAVVGGRGGAGPRCWRSRSPGRRGPAGRGAAGRLRSARRRDRHARRGRGARGLPLGWARARRRGGGAGVRRVPARGAAVARRAADGPRL